MINSNIFSFMIEPFWLTTSLVACVVAAIYLAVMYRLWKSTKGPSIRGALVVRAVDADGDGGAVVDESGVVGATLGKAGEAKGAGVRSYMAFAGLVARIVKVRMGVPKDTPANRIVAWELCGKELVSRNVRKCDIAKFQSLAHRLVFVPSKWDRLIDEAMASDDVLDRMVPYDNRRSFWAWLVGYKAGLGKGKAGDT